MNPQKLAVIFVVTLLLVGVKVPLVEGALIHYESFEYSLSAVNLDSSKTVSFPENRYLVALAVWAYAEGQDTGNLYDATVKVKINGDYYEFSYPKNLMDKTTQTGELLAVTIPVYSGTSFDIFVSVSASSGGTEWVSLKGGAVAYFSDTQVPMKSEADADTFNTIPPGAKGTSRGFSVYKTEMYLPTNTLNSGTLRFYLKWDGSYNTKLFDNIGIDSSGYLYVTNDQGQTFRLEVQPPVGQYVPVTIGWANNEGYIMMDTAKVTFAWRGSLTLSKIGALSNTGYSAVDEVELYDEYIPSDSIPTSQGVFHAQVYINFPSSTTLLDVVSMDGSYLSNFSVAAYSQNWTLITSDSWSENTTALHLTMPKDEGVFIVARTDAGSSTVYVSPQDRGLSIAVPGMNAQYIQTTIEPSSYPSQEQREWRWLIVKDSFGRHIYRNKWSFSPTEVLLKAGDTYLISVATDDFSKMEVVYTGLAAPTIKINLPSLSELTLFDELATYWRLGNDTIQIYYYDPQDLTEEISLVFKDEFGNTILNTTFPNTSLVNFKSTIIPFSFELSFTRENRTTTLPVLVGHATERAEENSLFLPKGVTGLVLVSMMMFLFPALNAAWAPLLTLVFGTSLKLVGLIDFPTSVAVVLSTLGFLAFIENANFTSLSLKHLAGRVFLFLLLLQIASGIATIVATQIGVPISSTNLQDVGTLTKEQLIFWKNYTPVYTDLGVPVSTDTKNFLSYVGDVFNGSKYALMALGAPESVATALQVVMWMLESVLGLYLLVGREV